MPEEAMFLVVEFGASLPLNSSNSSSDPTFLVAASWFRIAALYFTDCSHSLWMLCIAVALHMHRLLRGMHVLMCLPHILPCRFALSQMPAISFHRSLLRIGRLHMPALLCPMTGTSEVMYTANPHVCLQVTYLPACMNLVLLHMARTIVLNACS